MADSEKLDFTYKELVSALIRERGIHDGIWGLVVEFGLAAANVALNPNQEYSPAAIIPVVRIGIQRSEETTNLTVDASRVNPIRKARAKARKTGRALKQGPTSPPETA